MASFTYGTHSVTQTRMVRFNADDSIGCGVYAGANESVHGLEEAGTDYMCALLDPGI